MPVDRRRDSKPRKDEQQLVWTSSVNPQVAGGDIAFAPNVTPGTFNDPPNLVDAPSSYDSIMFPLSSLECPPRRRTGHGKKKPEDYIPRPPNAFILFRSSFIKNQHVSTEVETSHSTLSKIIGITWQNLPNEERQIWHRKAKAALDEHKRKFPQYAFKPLHNRSKGAPGEKRKVREVGPKDEKRCAKIAELLVNGKKGPELDAAIMEFDKHHVPEIVTRFEAPMTEKMYRRPSSTPIPDKGEPAQPFLSSKWEGSSKPRASSSQPSRQPTPSQRRSAPLPVKDEPASVQNAQAFDLFSAGKPSPSFEFNTFSFDTTGISLPTFPCESLTQAVSPLDGMFMDSPSPRNIASLSVDTGFLESNNWTRSPSPLTPTGSTPNTPSYFDNPALEEPYSTFTLESTSDYTVKSFGDLSQYPIYSNEGPIPTFNGSDDYTSSASGFASFDSHLVNVPMISADLDFSTFMASLPQYTI